MSDSTDCVPPGNGQDRRWIATRSLADATGIGGGTGRRPASALTVPRPDALVESLI